MRFDVLVVGGGTAGCVLAARLSESPSRQRLPPRGRARLRTARRGALAFGDPRCPRRRSDPPMGARSRGRPHAGRTGARRILLRQRLHGRPGHARGLRRVGRGVVVREPRSLPRARAQRVPHGAGEHGRSRPLPPRVRRGRAGPRLPEARGPGRPARARGRGLVPGERRGGHPLERGTRLPRRLPRAPESLDSRRHARGPRRRPGRTRYRRRRRRGSVLRGGDGRAGRRRLLLSGDPHALGDRPRGPARAARDPARPRPPGRHAPARPLRRHPRVDAVRDVAGRCGVPHPGRAATSPPTHS